MKMVLIAICLASISTTAFAECRSVLLYGQHKTFCDSSDAQPSNTNKNPNSIEYTEIPQSAKTPINKQNIESNKLASLEKKVARAHLEQSPFKPTHTQLDQVRQLLEYAKSQGCTWGGKFDQPELICPTGN